MCTASVLCIGIRGDTWPHWAKGQSALGSGNVACAETPGRGRNATQASRQVTPRAYAIHLRRSAATVDKIALFVIFFIGESPPWTFVVKSLVPPRRSQVSASEVPAGESRPSVRELRTTPMNLQARCGRAVRRRGGKPVQSVRGVTRGVTRTRGVSDQLRTR